MIAIDNTLVSEDLLEKKFVCDLNACKGACCVEGDAGAPLEKEEVKILEDIYDRVKPYMLEDGVKTIEKYGFYVVDEDDGDWCTPLVDRKPSDTHSGRCAFVMFDNGIAQCAIEKAYYEGKVDFKKPISCHLYPVRITKYKDYDAVNYNKWHVCKPACACGEKLQVPVYKFVKESLVRKYGESWYKKLEVADKLNITHQATK